MRAEVAAAYKSCQGRQRIVMLIFEHQTRWDVAMTVMETGIGSVGIYHDDLKKGETNFMSDKPRKKSEHWVVNVLCSRRDLVRWPTASIHQVHMGQVLDLPSQQGTGCLVVAADTLSGFRPFSALVAVVTCFMEATSRHDGTYGAQLSIILRHLNAAFFHFLETLRGLMPRQILFSACTHRWTTDMDKSQFE